MYIHKVVPHQLRWVPKSTHRGTENHCGCIRVVQKLISSSVFCAILGYYMLLNIIVPCLLAFSNIVLLVGFFSTRFYQFMVYAVMKTDPCPDSFPFISHLHGDIPILHETSRLSFLVAVRSGA